MGMLSFVEQLRQRWVRIQRGHHSGRYAGDSCRMEQSHLENHEPVPTDFRDSDYGSRSYAHDCNFLD